MSGKLELIKDIYSKSDPRTKQLAEDFILGGLQDSAKSLHKKYELEMSSEYIIEARDLKRHWGMMQGVSTGYNGLDKLTKGLVPGELIVVGGATSNGKTALAVNIAARQVASGRPVLFVTMEMTKAQVTSRLCVAHDNFEENAALVYYQKSDELNWTDIDGLIEKGVREAQVQLVVIDHLHYFTRELERLSEDLGRITKEIKKNAMRHKIPIILISHTRKGKGDSLDELRGSSYIAQDADIVLMVSKRNNHPDSIFVACEKNRNRGYDFEDNEKSFYFMETRITE